MIFKQYLQLATSTLWRHRLRSMLTGLGIVIGITAVIVIISAGRGVKGFLMGQFDAFGTNIIQTEVKTPSTAKNSTADAQSRSMGTVVTTLKISDMLAIRKHPNIVTNYAGQMSQAIVTALDQKKTVYLYGLSSTYLDIDTSKVAQGRFFTESEDNSLARVAVLGTKVASDLFGDADPVGQTIKIKQNNFQIIGLLAPRGSVSFFDLDNLVYVPIQTLQKQISGIDYVTFITSQYRDKSQVASTVADIEDILRTRHKIDSTNPDDDDFTVQTMDDAANILDTVIGGFTLLLIALASISLIVGGVGITNIMYVSVLERTFEIGLRKAVGAQRQQILKQFLMEAVILTGFGGITGIILGVAISALISVVAKWQGFAWDFAVPLYGVILAVGFSVGCGLVFGLYPARRAADLDPIEALRRE